MYNSIAERPNTSNLGVLSKHYKKMGGILKVSIIYILPSFVRYMSLVCSLSFKFVCGHSLSNRWGYFQSDYREKGGKAGHFLDK